MVDWKNNPITEPSPDFCIRKLVFALISSFFVISIINFIIPTLPSGVNETISNDMFTIKYKVHNIENIEFITFYVEGKNDQIIYSCPDNWRTFDFQGANFINGSNDILVSSGDIGDMLYKFNYVELTWTKQPQIVYNDDGSTQFYGQSGDG